jgi:hypothetical protein
LFLRQATKNNVCEQANLFSVKNLSPQNGALKRHFGWSQTPEAENFARLQGVRIVFSTEKFAKNFISGLQKLINNS